MTRNPAHPTTNPYGYFHLFEWNTGSPLYIWGSMWQLPTLSTQKHAFAINQQAWNPQTGDCCSAKNHWNPTNERHGAQEATPSHHGDLKPIKRFSATRSDAWYSTIASEPTLHGTQSILGKAMTIYEHDDDLGLSSDYTSFAEGNAGIEIACCNIKLVPFKIKTAAGVEIGGDDQEDISGDLTDAKRGRGLSSLLEEDDEDDQFSAEDFMEMFGFDIEELGDLSFLQD